MFGSLKATVGGRKLCPQGPDHHCKFVERFPETLMFSPLIALPLTHCPERTLIRGTE